MNPQRKETLKKLLEIRQINAEAENRTRFILSTPVSSYWAEKKLEKCATEKASALNWPQWISQLLSRFQFGAISESTPNVVEVESTTSTIGLETDEEGAFCCPICYTEDPNQKEVGSVNGCGHHFCLPCLLTWSRQDNHCPLCRQNFEQVFQLKQGIQFPVRSVFHVRDFRRYINEDFVHLRTHELVLEYDVNSIVMLKN